MLLVLKDTSNKLSIEDLLQKQLPWQSPKQSVPNLGADPYSYWIKFQIRNTTSDKLLIELAYPIIDKVEFYKILPDNSYVLEKMGEYQPFINRTYNVQNYIFDLDVNKNETRTYIMKLRGGEQKMLPLTIGTPQKILESNLTKDIISGIYYGIVLVMFFYNLFIYFTVQDKIYLYYVIYIILVGLTQACLKGHAFKYIWPENPEIASLSVYMTGSLVGIATLMFLRKFLDIKSHTPFVNRIINILIVSYAIAIILALSGKYKESYPLYNASYSLINLNAGLGTLFMLYTGYKIARTGYRPAQFFLLAWSIFLLSVLIFVLKDYVEAIPYNTFTYFILEIGSAGEIVLLSFALADRINILKREKEESQTKVLAALKENERIIREQNVFLEAKVKERTTELEASNKDLQVALNNLKQTQSQLVNSEKMASLGQLTAGIAHEINNPINFVLSNITPLKRDIEDILSVLNKYADITSDIQLAEKLKEIDKLKKDLDVNFLIEEINLLLKGIEEGAFRTSEIIKGLKIFSRIDEAEFKKANVNEGLDSTLILLNNRVKDDKIQVIKEYGALPDIECFPGKLNQVFMNILTNSIQALNMNENGAPKTIHIRTKEDKQGHVIISIRDSGPGMPEPVKAKIFEPFFTTKEVGVGTGLGLSIVYSIIASHKGDIRVESEPGKGAEFIITLPEKHGVKEG